jgi:hypothetical protein
VPSFPVGTRRFAIVARVPGLAPHPKVLVSVSTPDNATTVCEHVQVDAVGDHLLVTIGVTPLIEDGIYRFEVALTAQPSASIDRPIVIGDPQRQARLGTPGAVLSLRGIHHVGPG